MGKSGRSFFIALWVVYAVACITACQDKGSGANTSQTPSTPVGAVAPVTGSASTAPAAGTDAVAPDPTQAATPAVQMESQKLAVSTFTVTGMTCEDCDQAIEGKLIKMPGVTTVAADYKTSSTKVQYDPDKCSPAEMVQAIDSLGYKAELSATEVSETPSGKIPAGKVATPAPKPAPATGK